MVDLLQQPAIGGTEERRSVLKGIVDHANRHSTTIRLHDGRLTVEGFAAPQEVPFVRTFIRQMNIHRIAEIRVPHEAAAVDILEMLRALSLEPKAQNLSERLAAAGAHSVGVVSVEAVQASHERRRIEVSEAVLGAREMGAEVKATPPPAEVEAGDAVPAAGAAPQPQPTGGVVSRDFVPAKDGAAYGQMVELAQASSTTLASAVRRLRGHPDGPELSKGLNAIAAGVVAAVRDQRVPEAIDAVIAVIGQEEEEHREEVRLRYGVALRRILQPEVLQPLVDLLLDPIYAKDIASIMRRAGARGTELLLDLLVQAPTFAERRAFMQALREVEVGTELIVRMLYHHEWFVVRNVADLVGEMHIEEGVSALGEAAKHPDRRVRLAAGLALAKIGTPSAVKHLGTSLRDEAGQVRHEVAKQVSGKGLAALAMPLVNAAATESSDEVRAEFYRALGRIGTADAVTALIKASKPGGLVIKRRVTGDRVAATEGLVLAAADTRARHTLHDLAKDRDRHVRRVAQAAVGDA